MIFIALFKSRFKSLNQMIWINPPSLQNLPIISFLGYTHNFFTHYFFLRYKPGQIQNH